VCGGGGGGGGGGGVFLGVVIRGERKELKGLKTQRKSTLSTYCRVSIKGGPGKELKGTSSSQKKDSPSLGAGLF